MIKKHLLVVMICGIAMLVAAAGIYAKAAPDVIKLQDPAYKEHKKGVVDFSHKSTTPKRCMQTAGIATNNIIKNTNLKRKRRPPAPIAIRKRSNHNSNIYRWM